MSIISIHYEYCMNSYILTICSLFLTVIIVIFESQHITKTVFKFYVRSRLRLK